MDKLKIKIYKKNAGITIKEYLKEHFVGRGKIEEIRVNKAAFINGESVNLEHVLANGETLEFKIEEKVDFIPMDDYLEIVYEDENILVVNKPSMMIVHPDDKNKTGTLVNLVANYYLKNKIYRHVRFINRLDEETTGLVLFAKDFLSEAKLHHDMEVGAITREYMAICLNRFSKNADTLTFPIGGDRHNKKKQVVTKNGKQAITKYEVVEKKSAKFSLVKFQLMTGRTHQIRVHMAYINHPIAGDTLYGGECENYKSLALHSYRLTLFHPLSNDFLEVANLPQF